MRNLTTLTQNHTHDPIRPRDYREFLHAVKYEIGYLEQLTARQIEPVLSSMIEDHSETYRQWANKFIDDMEARIIKEEYSNTIPTRQFFVPKTAHVRSFRTI